MGRSPVLTYRGMTAPRCEIARRLGINNRTIKSRIRIWGADIPLRTLFRPVNPKCRPAFADPKGKVRTIKGHAKHYGVSVELLRMRYWRYRKGEIPFSRVFLPHLKTQLHTFTHGGITDTYSGWARRLGLTYSAFEGRVKRFASSPELRKYIFAPAGFCRSNVFIAYRGETHTIAEWARITGLKPCAIRVRLKKGATPAQALFRGSWDGREGIRAQEANGNHTRRKLAALGIFA